MVVRYFAKKEGKMPKSGLPGSTGIGILHDTLKPEVQMESDNMKNAEDVVVESGPVGPSKTERQWAMGCHLIGLCGVIVPFPTAGLLGVLIVWLLKREDGSFIDDQGKESLNFQISLLIYLFACVMLTFIGIGIFLFVPLVVFGFVCIIMATIKASEGSRFRYPACIRLIK